MVDRISADTALIGELERSGSEASTIRMEPMPRLNSPPARRALASALGQVVLVLQGGGALGAYQMGVYRALHAAGVEPDWVVGTSIGAINGGLIAGNDPAQRLDAMAEFWRRVEHGALQRLFDALPLMGSQMANMWTIAAGIPAFFQPNPLAFWGLQMPLGAEAAGYYDTRALRATLADLVDFERINRHDTRLTVGAAKVGTGEMCYFDSRDVALDARHLMASAALPPAFPAVRIDGDLYWDGGILSNTPVEAVFDDNPRQSSIIFAVHVWSPHGDEPCTIHEVMNRQKDVQYSSRAVSHIARQKQIHRLRHVIAELARRLPEAARREADILKLAGHGCLTRMHVVRLLAQPLRGEDHTKDIDFSREGIRRRSEAGYADTSRVLEMAPWSGEFDPIEGFILHEAQSGALMTAG